MSSNPESPGELSGRVRDEAGAPNDGGAGQVPSDDSFESDPQLAALLDRKIVQTTTVDVGVKDVARTFTDIIAAADAGGGFVSQSVFSNSGDDKSADLTIRVPADQYQTVLGKVRGMGEVSNEGSDANDVTEEYTDLQARLRTLEATEQRYLELLGRADNINDILTVQDRLDGVRGQIEQTQGRIELLDHMTELATITVHLRPVGAGGGGGTTNNPLEAAQTAWGYSLETLLGIATVAFAVAAFTWWLAIPGLVVLAVTLWRSNKKPQTNA
jgi:hypothetical protein